MRFVPVNCLREGMILGRPLMGKNGELLLNSGAIIHTSYIEKIKELGYNGVYVDDDLSKEIEISEIINANLRFQLVKAIKETFIKIENGNGDPIESIRKINALIANVVDEIIANRELMVNMVDLKVFDDYTFYHSVNVTVLSIIIGIALNLNKNQLYKLGLSAILHDIGKMFIPKELLNKPGKLTTEEFQMIQSHSYKGYRYLKEKTQISSMSNAGILQHHEKYDGTGYPKGIKGKQISLFGRIIAIADVYDALTSDRPYRKALTPWEAMEYIMGGGGSLFDPVIVNHFSHRVVPYPIGTCVYLSNNKVGIVVENYPDCSLRPKIKIIRHGEKTVEPYFMDLKRDKDAMDVTIIGIADTIT